MILNPQQLVGDFLFIFKHMEAIVFKKLLTDLFETYNPDKLVDVDKLVTQYDGKEFDAIKTIYLKYNFKQSPFYNPDLGTDRQIKSLIDRYSSGDTKLEEEIIQEPVVEIKKEEVPEPQIYKLPFDIQLKFNFDSSDIILPDMSTFLYVSITQRIIFRLKSGGIVGVEVLDILDDYVSNPDLPTREIVLDKK